MRIVVTDRASAQKVIQGRPGATLLRVLTFEAGSDISADCGGQAICGTCHVYLDVQHPDRLPPPKSFEREVLEQFVHVGERSRLACQVTLDEAWGETLVRLAPEE